MSNFINVLWVRILSRIESGSGPGFYWCNPGPGADYINQSPGVSPDVFVVWLRILSIFQSGLGFYQASLGPDSTNTQKYTNICFFIVLQTYISFYIKQEEKCSP